MENFVEAIKNSNMNEVIDSEDAQQAFSIFYSKFLNTFNKVFPLKKKKRLYTNCKPWLSAGMVRSINEKTD